jgi:cytochrome c oxidase accessory protein FixG
VLFYGFATYGNAGWMREQVCKYMCPYARFQSAMFDKDTLIITYDRNRGEPRGHSHKQTLASSPYGDCVDCGVCVQACPTGIDIRDGLQYECIGCAACIDGCDQVMDKLARPRGLIRYSTTHAMEGTKTRVLRPRVLVYSAILLAITAAATASLYLRVPLKVDVIRDRAALARDVGDEVENVYRLQIMNTTEQERQYEIRVRGLEDIEIKGPRHVTVGPVASRMVPVRVRVERDEVQPGTHAIEFEVRALGPDPIAVRESSVFMVR